MKLVVELGLLLNVELVLLLFEVRDLEAILRSALSTCQQNPRWICWRPRGLPEWVAVDAQDYVRRAITHASDLQALAALRARLRQQVLASPIYDAARFAQHFETALRSIWQQWCGEGSTFVST